MNYDECEHLTENALLDILNLKDDPRQYGLNFTHSDLTSGYGQGIFLDWCEEHGNGREEVWLFLESYKSMLRDRENNTIFYVSENQSSIQRIVRAIEIVGEDIEMQDDKEIKEVFITKKMFNKTAFEEKHLSSTKIRDEYFRLIRLFDYKISTYSNTLSKKLDIVADSIFGQDRRYHQFLDKHNDGYYFNCPILISFRDEVQVISGQCY